MQIRIKLISLPHRHKQR